MAPGVLPYFIVLVAAALVIAALAVYTLRFMRTSTAGAFIGLAVCTSIYAVGYAFELASGTLEHMLFWNKVQYIGIPFIPAFWMLLAARYSGRDAWLRKPVIGGLFLLSAVTMGMDMTNAFHHLYYTAVGVNAEAAFPVIVLSKGPWYWIHVTYMNAAIIIGNVLLVKTLVRSTAPYRKQAAVMVAGSAVPWLAFFIYLGGLTPNGIDATPFALAVTGLIFAWGLFRYRIFDVVPVAKDSVFASMRDGALVLDTLDRIVDYNPAAAAVFRGLDASAIGKALADALPGAPELVSVLKSKGKDEVEFRVDQGDRPLYYRARRSPVFSRRGRPRGNVILVGDVSEHVWLKQQLTDLTRIDDLTGVFNRRHILELGRQEIRRAKRYNKPLSLIVLDLDHFKNVNDVWGHEAGDEVLKIVSAALQKALRGPDHFGRHGGEEFAALLPETTRTQALLVAERMRATVGGSPIRLKDGTNVTITASLGVADLESSGGESINDLLREADKAMYRAKAAGRNCVR